MASHQHEVANCEKRMLNEMGLCFYSADLPYVVVHLEMSLEIQMYKENTLLINTILNCKFCYYKDAD